MITTSPCTDAHSLEILRDGACIGYLQWHRGREPHIILTAPHSFLTLAEIEIIQSNYKEHRARVG